MLSCTIPLSICIFLMLNFGFIVGKMIIGNPIYSFQNLVVLPQ